MWELVIQLGENINLCPLIKKTCPYSTTHFSWKVSEMHSEMEMCFVVATHHVCV
jgi:hypothetical protein